MHWNVAPDALPGYTFVRVMDHWLNDCIETLPSVLGLDIIFLLG